MTLAGGARPHWWVTVPLMLGGGALIAVQAQLNGALAGQLGSGLRAATLAAVLSFGSGLVLLTLLAVVHRPMGRGVAALLASVLRRRVPPWLVLGGLGGAFFVVSQGLAAPSLGLTFFVLCFVAGQAVMALLVDHHGWGPNGTTALSRARLASAVLAVVAVGISGAGVLATVPVTTLLLLLAALPLLAGAVNSGQQGINGRLAALAGPWVTTWNNFFVGTLGLLGFLAVTLLLPGRLTGLPAAPWLYLGGIAGVGFIWASTVTVRVHGVLVVGVFAVAGQVLTAAAISLLSSPVPAGPTTWLAVLTSLLGAAVVGLSQRLSGRTRTGV
jgi:transporter family-2 protein